MSRLICWAVGHEWFPSSSPREYIPVFAQCLRCPATQIVLPYGECLGGHPMVEHYDLMGMEHELPREKCRTGRPM